MGATVSCQHGGTATPVQTSLRVKVASQAIVTQPTSYTVAGCSLTPVPPSPPKPFCATAQWTSGATRVTSDHVAVLLQDSQAVCATTGTGVIVSSTQTRVKGT
jgi:hypothetical protein